MRHAGHLTSAAIGAAAAMAAMLAMAAVAPSRTPATIDVQRINIREPDGTLRMVLSGAASEPGIIVGGREQPHPSRRSAGILFYNDEGTENGGLIFDGKRDAAGRHSGGSLTFDRYKQDQMVQVIASEEGAARHAGLIVNDQPEAEMDFAAIERARTLPPAQRLAAYRAAHLGTTRRVFLGRTDAAASELVLTDAAGKDRLRLRVDPAGGASIAFLDDDGRAVRTIAAEPERAAR